MATMFQDDGSSSVTSSSLQGFTTMSTTTTASPTLLLSSSSSSSSPYPWLKELKSEERGLYLVHLLVACANHVASGSFENANIVLDQISQLATLNGDTMQRIASYFTEALAQRILKSWPGIYKALHSTRMTIASDQIHAHKLFVELFPFLKAAFVVTNQAIVEAMEGEKVVHVIDLNAAEPAQWRALLQDLSARPEGPPHLRITAIHQYKDVLDQMAHILMTEAEKLDIPFQFNPILTTLEDLDFEKLRVKTGEALAISSVLQLHTLLAGEDEIEQKSTSPLMQQVSQGTLRELMKEDNGSGSGPGSGSVTSTKCDAFLRSLWGLSPKIMVVTEQDSNHNGSTLMERMMESLYFYAALFDCLESTVPRTSVERLRVEKMLLGEEIKNIIACQGSERKERHEKLQKWFQRMDYGGFSNVPLSYYGMLHARRLLQSYGCDGYKIKEENGCVVACWQDRSLFSVSAWRCRR
ncbi:scarecrow-like protein 3 [Impatiens glandulifera]|uniref:scarecrow-like protein 3 n=1 Tax=Impatiens glandulifera TaxID=253017 RepID=UPI001FB05378|nr:scarecrow-like protein 3 [Impatiens glandulifera]